MIWRGYLYHHQWRNLWFDAFYPHYQSSSICDPGMHNIVQRPVAVDGEVVVRPVMYVALSYDPPHY